MVTWSASEEILTPQLVALRVTGLLGQFDHAFDFPSDASFIIIHGPNGIGKTKLLELITATFRGDLAKVAATPFKILELSFADETELVIVNERRNRNPSDSDDESEDSNKHALTLKLARSDDKHTHIVANAHTIGHTPSLARYIERELPLVRVGPRIWRDPQYDDIISTAEVIERYTDLLPDPLREWKLPKVFRDFFGSLHVHLIETQRLLSQIPINHRPQRDYDRQVSRETVLEFSSDLVRRLREVLAINSRTSQEKDRSFPRRILLPNHPGLNVTDDVIRERYAGQSDLRSKLAEIAVLDTSADLPLPNRQLEDWERRVLWTYLEDTDEKLATFQDLLGRVRLLRDIVNSRFLYKELTIDREKGFKFITNLGQEVGADRLSSGEQHELVLVYDLLFNGTNRLVLIDEPEISLHVAWQQRFIEDIERISQVANSRFIVATHSPQIIHKWWDQTVRLSATDELASDL